MKTKNKMSAIMKKFITYFKNLWLSWKPEQKYGVIKTL